MRVRIRIKHGEILFSSPVAKRAFFERTEGKNAILDIDDAPTANMRRYFEGAMVPAVYYQHPNSGWIDFRDAREALKLEFLPDWTHSLKGERVKVAKSTADLTKEGFVKLLDAVTGWLLDNGMEAPDPEEYKAWRDSAPPADEVYPPLARLKKVYDEKKVKTAPWQKNARTPKK